MNTGRCNRDVSTAASLNRELYREVVRYYLVRGACRERASNCDDPGNTAVGGGWQERQVENGRERERKKIQEKMK
ncbi:hypothetical protein ALC62_04875 [Cyphomyrmex costatus]|uniref:Uncharacterized protein n=1 Tax=Cyphomyrmex costatus TaxID=456900 RepID=A0A195CTU3_9HYME|nr:hypothetical protein ALC62_04875 [Cyphomyrmex costatus]